MNKAKVIALAIGTSLMSLSAVAVQAESYRDYESYFEVVDGKINITQSNDNLATIDGVLFNKENKSVLRFDSKNPADTYEIPEGILTIGTSSFSFCRTLTSVTIPAGVTSIDDHAFLGCVSLSDITIPDGVTSIGEWAFSGCDSLTSITIPKSVTSIGDGAFSGCAALVSLTLENTDRYEMTEDTLIDKEKKTIVSYLSSSSRSEYEVPEDITKIGDYSFYDSDNLVSVAIPAGVTAIGECAFSSCSSLESVVIPESVTSIGRDAFRSCGALTAITIPDSVTNISYGAFEGCDDLTITTTNTYVQEFAAKYDISCKEPDDTSWLNN